MKKTEIRNIINSGWTERRLKIKKKNKKSNEQCKEWKEREKLGLNDTKRRLGSERPWLG